MSRSEAQQFTALIKEATQGKTLLTVEHDMSVLYGLVDKIAVLVQGELLAYDSVEQVRGNPAVQLAYLGEVGPVASPEGQ
jgi:branched-chain amino acid transport system ATP-binding protein